MMRAVFSGCWMFDVGCWRFGEIHSHETGYFTSHTLRLHFAGARQFQRRAPRTAFDSRTDGGIFSAARSARRAHETLHGFLRQLDSSLRNSRVAQLSAHRKPVADHHQMAESHSFRRATLPDGKNRRGGAHRTLLRFFADAAATSKWKRTRGGSRWTRPKI